MATLYETRRGQMFPKLTPVQLSRLEAYGQRALTREGDVLVESDARYRSIVAVLSGSVDIVRSSLAGEAAVTLLTNGDFSGEMSALNGTVAEPRMYQLIRQGSPIDDRLFEIEFLDEGVEVFVFTFG